MKNTYQVRAIIALTIFLFAAFSSLAQSPGQIVRRSSASTVLDPNGDSYISLPVNTGFTSNDITQSEIPFKTIPLPFSEPIGDLATGQNGSFTDLVTSTTDKSGLMAYYDGTNMIFRLRVGGISAGAKAYSILIDADNKAGNTGAQADPNYVAPTAQGTGNIGFEWEVLLSTGNSTRVTIYETDGKTGSNIVQASQVTNGNDWQIAQALTTNSNNPDYFYDFYVPLSAFTGTYAITNTTQFRMVATTVNSPTSALTGSRSDIFGANDVNYSSTPDEWLAVLNGTPPLTLTNLSSGSVAGICTNAPVITSSSVSIGSGNSISGTWTRRDNTMDANATITIYRYSSSGALLNTYTSTSAYPGGVSTGNSWTVTGITAASGDYFIAKAKGTSSSLNESECMQSNVIYSTCSSAINPTVLTASGAKGMCGSLTTGATTALIYKLDATGVTLMNPGSANTTNTATTFTWFSCSGSTNNVSNGTYMVILTGNGCQSTPVFDCISSGNGSLSGLTTNAGITFPSTIYPYMTSISGSIPSSTSAQSASIFVNGVLKSTITIAANATTYTFSGLRLKAGDNIQVYLSPGSGCTTYNSATVACYNQPPLITTDANGKLLAGATTINGTSAANASITLYKTYSATASYTATANSSGDWSVTIPALTAGDKYTAVVTSANGCNSTSVSSDTALVVNVTSTCPAITGTPYNDGNTIVTGTVNITTMGSIVRLYLDGTLVGSQTMNTVGSNQSWSITSSQPFYNGAVLKATFQNGTSWSENSSCGTTTVVCTSPTSPGITPASSTINTGQAVTYTVSNLIGTTWYAVQDNSGISYATSIYTSASPGSSMSLSTSTFNTAGTYNLKITADKLTGCAASYAAAVVTVNAVSLPVKFINVAAKNNSNGILVSWQVADETNVKGYVVERSYDGRSYASVGSVDYHVPISNTNQYSFTDASVTITGKVYYRIRQVDMDGRFTYSTVTVVSASAAKSIQVFPNPAVNEVTVNITVTKPQLTTVDMLDVDGKKVISKTIYLVAGGNSFAIDHLSFLPRGTYFLKMFADGDNCHHKIIIK